MFGRLGDFVVRSAKGRVLVFFSANVDGEFDDCVEYEGMEVNEEKWIVCIWVY